MEALHNPFSPGAGSPPPVLTGRGDILSNAMLSLARIKQGKSAKSTFLVGLRGTGKTVLLQEIAKLAENAGYQVIDIEAHEKKSLAALLLPQFRKTLFALDRSEHRSYKVKRALSVLRSFISAVKLSIHGVDIGLDVEPEKGTADSGDLEADLAQLFVALGEAALDQNTAIAIVIDELQYLNENELSALIMAVHKVSQKALPITVIGAGLPQLVGKAGQAKSYAERLFDYPEIGPLKKEDAKNALQKPVEQEGVRFTEAALDKIVNDTQGYPYFLQEWGQQAWNIAQHSPIDADVAEQARLASIPQLDQNFFRVRFDRLTPREKQYLRALAEFGSEPQRSGDIADKLKLDVQQVAPIRNNLIKKGMIYSPHHGDTAFTVPLFDDFMKRIMPLEKGKL